MSESGVMLRLRGLPWSTTKTEIVDFFDPIPLAGGEAGVEIIMSRDGRPSGEAYVTLENSDDLEDAKDKNHEHIGRRYVEVFEVREDEIDNSSVKYNRNMDDCIVRLRGLPYRCSKEEILQFFDGLEIVPNGIVLPTDQQGRPSGDAYVQFVDKETAVRSQERHKEKIGHRYIEIFTSSEMEMSSACSPSRSDSRGPYGGSMGGGFSTRSAPYDSRDRFGGANRYGGAGARGGRYDDDSYGGRDNGYSDIWASRNRMGGGGGRLGGGRVGRSDEGHCVHMRGLPFKATQLDIADFFRPLMPLEITIMKDNTGRPSGEAEVEFSCHDDAMRAMSRDKGNMQHRYIELFLNSSNDIGPIRGNERGNAPYSRRY